MLRFSNVQPQDLRVSDLPFPQPFSDSDRIANILWLLDNNPSGQRLLPAEYRADDAPRFAATVPAPGDGALADGIAQRLARETAPGAGPESGGVQPQIGPVLLAENPSGSETPGDYLRFNGKKLRWHAGDGTVKAEWNGVSGASGFQSREYQTVKDKGPLPEGAWNLAQKDHQEIDTLNNMLGMASPISELLVNKKLGKWPGGAFSWGTQRVQLTPAEGTETHGRSGFSIHGGAFPGSAGCIDLTKQMGAFGKMFRNHGKDMTLYVDYGED
jgi:hypothetical protein